MAQLNFTDGVVFDSPLTGEQSFTFLNPPGNDGLVERMFTEYTETFVGDCSFGFVRAHESGTIYAVAYNPQIQIESNRHEPFMDQFEDWIQLEGDEIEVFGISFPDQIKGFLPDWWAIIIQCMNEAPMRKTKNSKSRVWTFEHYQLAFDPIEGGTFTLTQFQSFLIADIPVTVCKFIQNEVIKAP